MSQPIDPSMATYDPRKGPTPAPQQQQYADNYRQPPLDPNMSNFDTRSTSNQYRNPSAPSDNFVPPQYQNRIVHPANGVQQMQQHAQSQHHTSSPRMPQTQHAPQPIPKHISQSPSSFQQQQQQSFSAASSSTPIDPRLFAPAPVSQQPQQHQPANHHSRTPTPSAAVPLSETLTATPSQINGISQASTIPSIGSIMNGASKENANSPSADTKDDRSGDRTPGGSAKKESGPQDIPSDKLGFSEDMRTLKVLDKSFKA